MNIYYKFFRTKWPFHQNSKESSSIDGPVVHHLPLGGGNPEALFKSLAAIVSYIFHIIILIAGIFLLITWLVAVMNGYKMNDGYKEIFLCVLGYAIGRISVK